MKHRDKKRLYIAYYLRPKHPDVPHQALMVGPKRISDNSSFTKFHVKNTLQILDGGAAQPWIYEMVEISDLRSDIRLLALACVGKVVTPLRSIRDTLESIPIYQIDDPDVVKAKDFNCVS